MTAQDTSRREIRHTHLPKGHGASACSSGCCKLSEKRDVYHLVNLVSPTAVEEIRARRGRGMEVELQSVVALVCEIDTNTGEHRADDYPTQEAALDAISAMPLTPSVINLSGLNDGGLHVYWILKRPQCVVDSLTRKRIKAISKAWQAKLREVLSPCRLDSTFDLVRVLRVPGCRNHKYQDVVTRPFVVEDRHYCLEEFARYVEPTESREASARSMDHAASDSARLERCRNYLGRIPDAISGQQGHNKTFRAACECFRFGLSRLEARDVLEWFNQAKTPAEDKWSEAELAHKLETAYKTVEDAGEFGVRLER